jgi:glycosyltransferase involved in cell wall biosynthesis
MIPTFSIIIPTYNRANLLPETIRSVQNQTYTNWECIVVDDGSTDGTRQVVEAIIKSDSRIKYFFQENAERSAARNNGIRNSSGEYICFLDSDDHLLPNHLYDLGKMIDSQRIEKAMVIYQAINISNEKQEVTKLEQPGDNLVEFIYLNPISPSRVCVSKDVLDELNFDEDIVIVEDVILWMKIANSYPVYVTDHIGVKYHIHGENSVDRKGNGSVKMYAGVVKAKKRYPQIFSKIPDYSFRDWTSRIITNVAYHHILNQRKILGIYWLIKALLMKPKHIHTQMRINHIYKLLTFRQIEI